MTDNLFEIGNPDDYLCMVESFSIGLAVLTIEVMKKSKMSDQFRLQFFPVEYFSGPIVWYSANFQIAPREETLRVLARLERYSEVSVEELFTNRFYALKLYKVVTAQNTIEIVAGQAVQLQPGDKGVMGNL